jgi:hypothetical protein
MQIRMRRLRMESVDGGASKKLILRLRLLTREIYRRFVFAEVFSLSLSRALQLHL